MEEDILFNLTSQELGVLYECYEGLMANTELLRSYQTSSMKQLIAEMNTRY